MTLGEKLKSYRTNKKISQEKVAELVGVSRQAVTKWENDQTVPTSNNLITLASIYGVSVDSILLFGHYSKLYFLGTLLVIIVALYYILIINPKYMNRQLTKSRNKKN